MNTEQSLKTTGNRQQEERKRKKREGKGHQSRRHYDRDSERQRGERAAVGELFGCSEGRGVVCWLMVGMEHLMIICLFSDGLHGMAHLFYMSEPPHVARTRVHTSSQRRRWNTNHRPNLLCTQAGHQRRQRTTNVVALTF